MRKLLSSLLLALPIVVLAQTASIEQCQQWAQENYPLTQRYDLIRQTEGFTLKNIAKGWLPQIGVSAQGSYQSAVPEYPEVLTNMLSQMGTEMKGVSPLQYRTAIDVQQTIYDGGRNGSPCSTLCATSSKPCVSSMSRAVPSQNSFRSSILSLALPH